MSARCLTLSLICWLCPVICDGADSAALAERISANRGLCVLIGDTWEITAVDLAKRGQMVYVQSPQASEIARVRSAANRAGMLNVRIYAEQGDIDQIHLGDNLADSIVVADPSIGKAIRDELLRVLRPGGQLLIGDESHVKPVPVGTGDWSHPYHGPDNNPMASDTLAKAPYLTQFLATPWYGPMPEITLSAGGRIFKVFGHLAFKQREWPMLGKLVCMNGYNGMKLWQRDLTPGFMVHRNTMVATDSTLYLADHQSCKLIDTTTGKTRDEIAVPADSGGPVWKWMTVRDGVLYALVGAEEKLHQVQRGNRTQTGWPWTTVRSTYNPHQESWGYGKTLLAIDLTSKEVLWSHRESQPIDSRAVCMNDDSIFLYSHQNYVAAIGFADGKQKWQSADKELLEAIGAHNKAQDPRLGYWTSSYVKCTDDVLLFAGPQRKQLVSISADDGTLLWTYRDGNVQMVLRPDGLYAMGRLSSSKKFDYTTGKILKELDCFRGNCTRATGTVDSIFARGYRHSGTLRFDLAYQQPRRLAAMRPACQDGVVAANGLLYWGPWMCDCNHSLVGVVSLGTAGDFEFEAKATDGQRLETLSNDPVNAQSLADVRDWPTYRGNNQRSASTTAKVIANPKVVWTRHPAWKKAPGREDFPEGLPLLPTSPVAVGDLAYFSGADGIVYAVDATDGRLVWKAFTGGAVRYPPTVTGGRVYVGSADGRVHCFAATDGRRLWRFRAAPAPRKIPVYDRLSSNWPVSTGVMVNEGTAYAGAGIASHDGTHVMALDAISGRLKWQNITSGNLTGEKEVVGVSVQGHMLLHNGKVFMAGGNVVSPAIYDAATGKCLNTLSERPKDTLDDHWQMQRSSRGSELFLVENQVKSGGRMMYSPRVIGPPSRYLANYYLQAGAGKVVIQGNENVIVRADPQSDDDAPSITWKNTEFARIDALVLAPNAVVVAGLRKPTEDDLTPRAQLAILNPNNGAIVWGDELPASAIPWGVAVNRDGQILVSLSDGCVLGYAE